MKALKVKPLKQAKVITIDGSLESLQKEVGGYIEAIYPFDDDVALVCNEEGKLLNLPMNRVLRDKSGKIYDVIHGDFLVVGLGEEDFTDLPADLLAKYKRKYARTEEFVVDKKTGHIAVYTI